MAKALGGAVNSKSPKGWGDRECRFQPALLVRKNLEFGSLAGQA